MGDIIYLRITGEQQGDISAGCGTQVSVGNRYQQGHEDEIFVFSFQGGVSNTGFGINHQAIQFCKILDKSSPLLMNCINNNERCRFEFYFYRINKYGKWERYYYIEVRGATLTQNQIIIKENELDYQYITIHYEYIYCKHLTANTEFSYLLTPKIIIAFSHRRSYLSRKNQKYRLNEKLSSPLAYSLMAQETI